MYFLRKFASSSTLRRLVVCNSRPNILIGHVKHKNVPRMRCMSTNQQPDSKGALFYLGAGFSAVCGTTFVMYQIGYFDKQPNSKPEPKKGNLVIDERTAGILAASNTKVSEDTIISNESAGQQEEVKLTLPEEVPYLIIGAGTAANAAFKAIRTQDPESKVLIIGEEDQFPYMRPPLSKELWFTDDKEAVQNLDFKSWNGRSRSIYFEKEQFFCSPHELNETEHGGVAVAKGKKVTKLDVSKQIAILSDGTEIKYGKCLLATGGKPRTLPVLTKSSPEVVKKTTIFRNVEDFKRLDKITNKVESVAVIGGGFLGSELACALGKRAGERQNLKVYQTFPESGNMGMVFPEYLSKWSMEKVRREGVEVLPETMVVGCNYNAAENKVDLKLNNGQKLSVDHVVCAVGLEPNIELAETSGLEVDSKHGGFLVNAELEARSNVWVAGDAACFYDTRLGRRRVEHHDHAVVSGRLAGENMTGAGKPYWHQSMFWSDLGPEVGYEAIGIVDSKLPTMAVFAKATESDTPKAAAEKTGEGLRSESSHDDVPTAVLSEPTIPVESDDFGKGVVFYLRNHQVVGMIMWNVYGKIPIARKVIKDGVHEDDVSEISKLFNLHGQKEEESS